MLEGEGLQLLQERLAEAAEEAVWRAEQEELAERAEQERLAEEGMEVMWQTEQEKMAEKAEQEHLAEEAWFAVQDAYAY